MIGRSNGERLACYKLRGCYWRRLCKTLLTSASFFCLTGARYLSYDQKLWSVTRMTPSAKLGSSDTDWFLLLSCAISKSFWPICGHLMTKYEIGFDMSAVYPYTNFASSTTMSCSARRASLTGTTYLLIRVRLVYIKKNWHCYVLPCLPWLSLEALILLQPPVLPTLVMFGTTTRWHLPFGRTSGGKALR